MKRNILTLVLAIVSSVWMTSEAQINSLCDTWNVVAYGNCFSAACPYITTIYTLTTDTIIGTIPYTKIETADQYPLCYGAMREGTNRDIYFIPSGGTHEYLLYAFNAQVGDLLSNLWISWDTNRNPNGPEGYTGIVQNITNGTPRIFTISITPREGDGVGTPSQVEWVEGVGFKRNPLNAKDYSYVDASIEEVLCAYKNGKQIYASALSEEIGCEYNGYGPEGNWRFFTLCDEWNVWHESFESFGPISFDEVVKYQLTTDTLINGQQYVKLTSDKDSPYLGAMREGNNRDIYYVPAGSTNEFLLYAFNAQVGEVLNDLYLGGFEENGYSGRVEAISDGSPRLFTIRVLYPAGMGVEPGESFSVTWIEGVGSPETPYGLAVVPTVPADIGVYTLLCAYKNGKHIYTSDMGEQYGCEYNGNGTPEPMFTSDTEWHYKSYDMFAYTDYTPTLSSISLVDTLINNIPYQKIGGILFRTKGTKVWCTMDSLGTPVERLVYDFGLQIGDSIRNVYYEEEFWMEQEYIRYAKVTSVEYITLSDGRSARRISYDNYRPDDIEHIGSVEGILFPLNFPVAECGCGDAFKCCTRNDFLLYEVSTGACDDFFEAEQPADTIPLFSYTGDDPGSSTVDPVDPNQVVVTLKGDELTIKETSGDVITYSLQKESSNKAPKHMPTLYANTFQNSVSVELTEEGLYRLDLSNPLWDYRIYGIFNYPQRKDAIDQNIVPQPAAEKIIRNGQLLIRKGEKVYTVQGTAINE